MLRLPAEYNHVLLIGSTSDIGLEIIKNLNFTSSSTITLIGRSKPKNMELSRMFKTINFHECDFEMPGAIDVALNQIMGLKQLDFAIISAGYLPPENCELSTHEIEKSLVVNGMAAMLTMSATVKVLQNQGSGSLLLLSTVATSRARIRNFTYGASKICAEFYALGLQAKYAESGVKVIIARPGFVFSKMTKNFKPAPFAITVSETAKIIVSGINKDKKVIYAPSILRLVMFILRILPRFLYNRL